jgi:DNA-binding response OmpR family regulator
MNGKILLLEDDRDIHTLITLHLENEGYQVVGAFDGRDALEKFDESIHLAVLDVMVPQIDGIEVLRRIRETSTIPVLFLTAKTDETDKLTALGIGADDYITKPFSVMEVLYRIKAHLRRNYQYNSANQSVGNMFSHKGIEMDIHKKTVSVDGNEVLLNAKEFELLQYFLENPGRVFTKKQLYEHVWDDLYYGDSNTIMVHISRLREKLGDDKKEPKYIRTIKSLGYRLEP